MAVALKSGRRRIRNPGLVYTALALAIVLVVAAMAITASQSPPPAIAELAPQAEQIKDAPPEQSSELGSADGGAGNGDVVTTTTSTAPPVAGASTTLPRRLRAWPGGTALTTVASPPRA